MPASNITMSSPNAPAIVPATTPGADHHAVRFHFENTFARFLTLLRALDPTPVAAPRMVKFNVELARELGLDPDELASERGVEVLAGNRVVEGAEPWRSPMPGISSGTLCLSSATAAPISSANCWGATANATIPAQGSGPTPFSRGGDGRAGIGPVLREYIVSEAMAALGVPTTRALAAVTTGERVLRDTVLPGAVLTRVAASHLRVGTFQYFAAQGDMEGLRMLADYAIARHYPEAAQAKQPYRALLDGVIARQARLVAQWMFIGFIHGVMNTDNTSISGETIDYGPCALGSIRSGQGVQLHRHYGRYAYGNEARVALWN